MMFFFKKIVIQSLYSIRTHPRNVAKFAPSIRQNNVWLAVLVVYAYSYNMNRANGLSYDDEHHIRVR